MPDSDRSGPAGALRELRIAQLIESDGPGGAEMVVVQLARTLVELGASIVVYVPEQGQGWIHEKLKGTRVTFQQFGIDRPFSPRFAGWLAESFRQHRIDVSHGHDFSMAFYGAWAARRAGIRHIITMHGGQYYAEKLRRRLALRWAVGRSAATVAVSPPVAALLARHLHVALSSITVIPNGIAHEEGDGARVRAELGLANGSCIILAIGNLYPVKGHAYLIRAMATIARRFEHVHVVIAGRGGEEAALRGMSRELQIEDRVHILGLRDDIPSLLASADIVALPSLSEGLPMAILEAMFAGRAIVASDVGGLSYALDHGQAGVLVPPADDRGLATALERLIADPALRSTLAGRARERAEAEFRVMTMVERYVTLYRR